MIGNFPFYVDGHHLAGSEEFKFETCFALRNEVKQGRDNNDAGTLAGIFILD